MIENEKIIDVTIEGSVEGDLTVTGERITVHISGDVSGMVTINQVGGPPNVTINGEPFIDKA